MHSSYKYVFSPNINLIITQFAEIFIMKALWIIVVIIIKIIKQINAIVDWTSQLIYKICYSAFSTTVQEFR